MPRRYERDAGVDTGAHHTHVLQSVKNRFGVVVLASAIEPVYANSGPP